MLFSFKLVKAFNLHKQKSMGGLCNYCNHVPGSLSDAQHPNCAHERPFFIILFLAALYEADSGISLQAQNIPRRDGYLALNRCRKPQQAQQAVRVPISEDTA